MKDEEWTTLAYWISMKEHRAHKKYKTIKENVFSGYCTEQQFRDIKRILGLKEEFDKSEEK